MAFWPINAPFSPLPYSLSVFAAPRSALYRTSRLIVEGPQSLRCTAGWVRMMRLAISLDGESTRLEAREPLRRRWPWIFGRGLSRLYSKEEAPHGPDLGRSQKG